MSAIYGVAPVPPHEVQDLWRSLLHPSDRERMEARLADLLADGSETALHDEFRIVRPDGEIRWVEFVARLRATRPASPSECWALTPISPGQAVEEDLAEWRPSCPNPILEEDQFLAMLAMSCATRWRRSAMRWNACS